MKFSKQPKDGRIIFLALISCLPCTASPVSVVESSAAPALSKQELPEILLRGYGKVSGKQYVFGDGSILKIVCENEDKAKLAQAK